MGDRRISGIAHSAFVSFVLRFKKEWNLCIGYIKQTCAVPPTVPAKSSFATARDGDAVDDAIVFSPLPLSIFPVGNIDQALLTKLNKMLELFSKAVDVLMLVSYTQFCQDGGTLILPVRNYAFSGGRLTQHAWMARAHVCGR